MQKFGIGQPLKRKEDVRLLTGAGKYLDDLSFVGQAHAKFLRSPHAHARVTNVDTEKAKKAHRCSCLICLDIPDH